MRLERSGKSLGARFGWRGANQPALTQFQLFSASAEGTGRRSPGLRSPCFGTAADRERERQMQPTKLRLTGTRTPKPDADSTCSPWARQQRAGSTLAVPGQSSHQVGRHTVQSSAPPIQRAGFRSADVEAGARCLAHLPQGNLGTRPLSRQGTDKACHPGRLRPAGKTEGRPDVFGPKVNPTSRHAGNRCSAEGGQSRAQLRASAGGSPVLETPQPLSRMEQESAVNPRHGLLTAGPSGPACARQNRQAEARAPRRIRATSAQQAVHGPGRITTNPPPGKATARGASSRSPGIGAPFGGSAGRVGGLTTACRGEIT
jgi:hypothetical protein